MNNDTVGRKPRAAPLLAVVGLLSTGLAAAALGKADPAAVQAARGGPQVVVTDGAYPAGHSSGWHVHPGLHSVVVLAGSLTIYDETCEPHDFGPGDSYLGGDRPHLVRNDRAAQATYVVTYAGRSAAGAGSRTTMPAPASCDLG